MRVESIIEFALSRLTFPLASPRRGLAGSYSNSVFAFCGSSLFQSNSAAFHSCPQCTRAPVSLRPASAHYFPLSFFSNSRGSGCEGPSALFYIFTMHSQTAPCTHARSVPAPSIVRPSSPGLRAPVSTLCTSRLIYGFAKGNPKCVTVSTSPSTEKEVAEGWRPVCRCQAEGV